MISTILDQTQQDFLYLYWRRQEVLEKLTDEQLSDLLHLCGENSLHPDYSMRVAAEVNRTASIMVLETRKEITLHDNDARHG